MKFEITFLVLILIGYVPILSYGESQIKFETDDEIPTEIHRIVVVGDVHGDPDNFRQILSMSDIISNSSKDNKNILWRPKWEVEEVELHKKHKTKLRTTFIQMGDLIDRGEDDLTVLEMVSSLLEQTRRNHIDDNVILLLGNHELLNLQGQFHYVHPNNMGGFLSKSLRKMAFEANGQFGRFLLDNFTVLHIDEDTVFVHAGLNEQFASLGVESLNKEIKEAIRLKNYRNPLLGSSGPLWTRQMIMDASNGHCTKIPDILSKIGVKRIVVGHTPQRSGHIETYCNDSVIAVDVGLSRWMYDNLAALEIMVTSYKKESYLPKKFIMREIVTSDVRRTQTIDDSLSDHLFLEELQHAVEEFHKSQRSKTRDDTIGDL